MVAFFLLLTWIGWGFFPAEGTESYCSLKVRVVSPSGADVDALVKVQEANGRTVERENEIGGVRFCDLGIMPVTVTVGRRGSCNQVVVNTVPLTWKETYVLQVVYDRDPCLSHPPPPPVPICQILFRISDPDGDWLSKARIQVHAPKPAEPKVDEFGRAELIVEVGKEVRGRVDADGYTGIEFRTPCTHERRRWDEHLVLTKNNTAP